MLAGNLVHAVEGIIDYAVVDGLAGPVLAKGRHFHAAAAAYVLPAVVVVSADYGRRKLIAGLLALASGKEQGHESQQ